MSSTHRAKTPQFIQAVKDYRIATGEGLRVAIENVTQQIEEGKLKIFKYCDGLGEYSHPNFPADKLQMLYLSWVNNYLSLHKFAEDKGLTLDQANRAIEAGREIYEAVVTFNKVMK